jgi:hypothetical protein
VRVLFSLFALTAVLGLTAALGCPRSSQPGTEGTPTTRGPAVDCASEAFAGKGAESFRHKRSMLIAMAASAGHSAQDVIALPGGRVSIAGKFTYGDLGKDLEDEEVRVHLGTCDAWTEVGRDRTDDDGRSRVMIEAPTAPGRYAVVHEVVGDGTTTRSTLTVAPSGTSIVVFDLDGTLTASDGEITRGAIDEKLAGDYEQAAYPGGPEVTARWAARGYLIVYLTGRPYWLGELSRRFLAQRGYAPGHLHTTDRHRDVVPSADGVGTFKRKYLEDLLERGFRIDYAYGNAPTDIAVYAFIGVPKDHTFIIGPHAGDAGTRPLTGDYQPHVTWVDTQPTADFQLGS